jgi:hypothetical protein
MNATVAASRQSAAILPASHRRFSKRRYAGLAHSKTCRPWGARDSSDFPVRQVQSLAYKSTLRGADFQSAESQVSNLRAPGQTQACRTPSIAADSNLASRQIGNLRHAFALAALLALTSTAPAQETRTYAGVATNITAGQAARFELRLTMAGNALTAEMTTEAPLAGRATLRGGVTNGLCKLSGDAAEGFRVDFSGTLDARQYGGTYVVTFPDRVQYGTFKTTRRDPPAPPLGTNVPPAQTNATAPPPAVPAAPSFVAVKGRYQAGLFNRPSTDGLRVGFAQPGTRLKVLETLAVSGVTWHRVQGQDGTVLTDQGRIVKDGWIRSTMVEPAP